MTTQELTLPPATATWDRIGLAARRAPDAQTDSVHIGLPVRKRLSYKQTRNIALLTLLLGLLFNGMLTAVDLVRLAQQTDAEIQQVLRMVREPAAEAAYALDDGLARHVLDGLFAYSPIHLAVIRTDSGDELARLDRPQVRDWLAPLAHRLLPQRDYSLVLTIGRFDNQAVGELRVSIDQTLVTREFFNRAALALEAGAGWTVALAGILAIMFHLSITRPLLNMARALTRVDLAHPAGSLIPMPPGHADDEFGLIAITTNTLLTQFGDSLERHRRTETALRESEERLKLAVTATRSGVWDLNLLTNDYYWSSEFIRMLGYEDGELDVHQNVWTSLVHPDDLPWCRTLAERYLKGEVPDYQPVYRMRRKDGSWIWIEDKAHAVRDADGTAVRFTGTMADVTERKRFEEQLMYMATHDPLTCLPNRTLLQDRLSHALRLARGRNTPVGVLHLDLDRFKLVNDSLGYSAGDQLLRAVATALTEATGASDTIGRLGDDEFLVIAEGLQDAQEAGRIAALLQQTLERPFTIEGHTLFIRASIGIAIHAGDDTSMPALLRHADTAMHSAKSSGGNTYRFFIPDMNAAVVERLALESRLRAAVAQNQFMLFYQPKVDLATLRPAGLEALIRWPHPETGFISPAQFIPVAEETGLIMPIGDWVLHTALAQIRTWQDAGIPPLPIAVNISARQLCDGNAAAVAAALKKADVAADLLEIEITETVMMDNLPAIIESLRELRELGVGIAVDDFGTGYSSLSYLRRLPITALKVDRSFIDDVTTNADDAAIAATIIAMGHQLGLKVVAEGIETPDQIAFLRRHHCDEMQGYLLGRPMPMTDLEARFLKNGIWTADPPAP